MSNPNGWTNYTPCFPNEVKTLLEQVAEDGNTGQYKFGIAVSTRYLEIVGFSISLIAILISLFIFSNYRSLHNNRTRIHKSLFYAMAVQDVIRLVLYIDQVFVRNSIQDGASTNSTLRGIDNMPYLCEIAYVTLEYAITVMFLWMFIEGLYLNNVVTANVFREYMSHKLYLAMGWGLPFLLVAVWAVTTAVHYRKEAVNTCWYGYNFLKIYWILQGPRLAVIVVNGLFLLNILRVLVMKLRRSDNTEVAKVRKAVRAAIVLLPLLGILNSLDMFEAPLHGSAWKFALWSYTTHTLRSFQGFFISLLYCFLNAEVRMVLRKHYENWKAMRETRRQRASLFRNNGRRMRAATRVRTRTEGTQTKAMRRHMQWSRFSANPLPRSLAEVQIAMTSEHDNRRSIATYTGPHPVGCRPSSFAPIDTYSSTVAIENEYRLCEFHDCRRSNPRSSYSSSQEAETST